MKIRLSYWKGMNLGDLLSPFIVAELSGRNVFYFDSNVNLSVRNICKNFMSAIRQRSFHKMLYALGAYHKNILAIGSILSSANRRSIVWGSGFISPKERCKALKICAVRGHYTANRLQELGYNIQNVIYGDPALLLPLFIHPSSKKAHLLGIIPHHLETEKYISKFGTQNHIIDIRTNDIEAFIENLTSCKYILSSSLHGIIIAHAYGIPALHIEKKKEKEYGYFKYDDYFSSVNIVPYHWIELDNDLLDNRQKIFFLFEKNRDKSLPQTDLHVIQKNLLKVAPFPLQKKYKRLIEE